MATATVERRPLEPVVPFCMGPTWQKDDDGDWLLPEHTLGWQIIGWIAENLLLRGEPIRLTDEQIRLILWIYALEERAATDDDVERARMRGERVELGDAVVGWVFEDIVLQRMKGWGKDPTAAMLAAVEFVGPCRFSHWATEADVRAARRRGDDTMEVGDPVGKQEVEAWVQITATAAEQTKNTAALLPGIFTKACIAEHDIDLGKQVTYAHGGTRRIEVTTSSWRTMEGNRPTFAIRNETHHWRSTNEGDELHQTIRRNLAKNPNGARGISITNAYSPGEGSVAQLQREKYLEAIELRGKSSVMYDSYEAPVGSDLIPPYTRIEGNEIVIERDEHGQMIEPTFETAKAHMLRIISAVRGDAYWLRPGKIVDDILSGEVPVEQAKRFYYNSISTGSDYTFDPEDIAATADPDIVAKRRGWEGDPLRVGWTKIKASDPIVIFGDGSKSNDSTGLVGCRLSDGYIFTIGTWQRPPGRRGHTWTAPRDEVDTRVHEVVGLFNVVAFWFDPSHTEDDETGAGYWDALVDSWHQKWGDQFQVWGQISGDRRSSVAWDMTSPMHKVDFVKAVARFGDDLETHLFQHDGHPSLVEHLRNARNYLTDAGWSISKESRSSSKKIDLAVCAVGARMLRRVVANKGLEEQKRSTGWWAPVDA
jgi:hypothetical protein